MIRIFVLLFFAVPICLAGNAVNVAWDQDLLSTILMFVLAAVSHFFSYVLIYTIGLDIGHANAHRRYSEQIRELQRQSNEHKEKLDSVLAKLTSEADKDDL